MPPGSRLKTPKVGKEGIVLVCHFVGLPDNHSASATQISGSGLMPPRVGLETAVLLALQSAAAQAELPLLSCNITNWEPASTADANRWADQPK
jgi:hypothetical protein